MPLVSGGGSVAAPLTLSGASGVTPLTLRVANDTVPALMLANDAWDTDPTDPVVDFFADDTGDAFLRVHGSGKVFRIQAIGGQLQMQAPVFTIALATAAPADAALSSTEFALWLDATPAATKLMVKAKDSGGTVRTASIALA